MNKNKRKLRTHEEKNAIIAIAKFRDSRIKEIDKNISMLQSERIRIMRDYSGGQLALQFDTTGASISYITKGRKQQ